MNGLLWIIQGLLAFAFLSAGGLKVLRPKAKIVANRAMGWATRFSATQIKLIGAAEVIGALGLVEPWATGIAPILTPIAAACFVVLMLGAAVVHQRRRESPMLPIALAVMAAVVAVARFRALAQSGRV
jgi:hypothetical protein